MSELMKKDLNEVYEDEIDLKELLNTVLKHKFKIILFSFFVTLFSFIYVLSIPNSYKSYVVLSPQSSSSKVSGGLSSLASLAGVNFGGGNSSNPSIMLSTTLDDYNFNKYVIEKYNLLEILNKKENLVFAFGVNSVYDFFNANEKTKQKIQVYDAIYRLKSIISISSDKRTGMITLSAELNDRFLAKKLVDIYLKEMIYKIRQFDMKEIENQIKYYKKELSLSYDVSLKEQLSKSLSALYQKKVFSQANEYYLVSKVIDSRIAHIKEKTKPKRALILVVSFVSSLILGIFLVFFLEFIKNSKNEENSKN